MSDCSQLPHWVSYLQALAVPILAVVVAGFGAWIAARQMLIAYDKLQHDAFDKLYDRRVAVYEATRKFMADVFVGNISDDEIRAYGLKTLDARFLFDDSLHAYLRQVCFQITAWHHAKSSEQSQPPGDEKEAYNKMKHEHLAWITQQGDEFTQRFMPYLKFTPVKQPWFLRWPS